MIQPSDTAPEITLVDSPRVWCDGAGDIRGGASFRAAALGHPRVWLELGEAGAAECGYCDRRFVLRGGTAAEKTHGRSGTNPVSLS